MDEEKETSGIPWQEILATLFRRWRLIAVVFVVGLIGSAILAFLQGPQYEASAKLMLTSERAHITVSPDPSSGAVVDRVTDQEINSEVALLKSPALIREVLEPVYNPSAQQPPTGLLQQTMAALRYPLDVPGRLYRRMYNVPPASPFDGWVQAYAAGVAVTPIKSSNLIQVTFWGSSPQWTAEFVNQLITHYVERRARLNQTSAALDFLESQRKLLSDKMRQAEDALAKFYDREHIDAGFEQRTPLRARVGELETALAKSATELAEATARAEFLNQELRTRPKSDLMEPRAAQNDPLQLIRTRIFELQLQRSELLSKFAPTSLKIQEVDRQIDEARQLLAQQEKEQKAVGGGGDPALVRAWSETQAQVAAVKARMESLRAQVAGYREKLDHLDQTASEQERLEQEVTTAKESFLTYTKKVEAARFSDALDQSRIVNVSVVEKAEVPTAPLPLKRSRTLMMGAIMSLAAGGGLAFLLDKIDPKVKSAAEAERVSGLPLLADIPS